MLVAFALLVSTAWSSGSWAKEVYLGLHQLTSESMEFPAHIQVKEVFEKLEIIALEIEQDSDLDFLRLDPNVAFIDEAFEIPAPKKFISKPYPEMEMVSKSSRPRRGPAPIPDDNQPRQVPVGVALVEADQVWQNFTQGEGIRVLVLDSGIDRDHPEFSANFEKGQNFTGGNRNNFADENGHGTHVAGTIAGSARVLGVAPAVKILAGKVCNTGCNSLGILRGVEWGITEGVDVINMSLGGGFGNEAGRRVYAKAEENNIVVVAASGNDGERRNMFPASYPEVFSVGAVDFDLQIASFSNWNDHLDLVAPGVNVFSAVPRGSGRSASAAIQVSQQSVQLEVHPMTGSGIGQLYDLEMEDVGLGLADDYRGRDVRGKVALVKRGGATFKEKYDFAINNGAEAILVYNNEDGDFRGTLNTDVQKVALTTSQQAGQMLQQLIASNPGEVRSQIQLQATSYQENSGTSMASPHVAGVAALLRAHRRDLDAIGVKEVLRSAAQPVPNARFPERYGRGFISALRALQ